MRGSTHAPTRTGSRALSADTPRARAPGCSAVRDAVSARFDGEDAPLAGAEVERHLTGCGSCAAFESGLAPLARRTRVVAAAPVPDVTAQVLAAVEADRLHAPDRRRRELRLLVGLAGLVQVVLAVASLGAVEGASAHLVHELAALQLALGLGFLLAALQPRRAPGVLPIAVVVVAATLVAAVVDVVLGRVTLVGELTHLAEVVGVAALWLLSRQRTRAAAGGARVPVGSV